MRVAAGVVCAGFEGLRVERELVRFLREFPLAGVVLFARNTESVEQTRALTGELRLHIDRPVIAIDQEGGRVMRLRQGVEELPSMSALGDTRDEGLARRAGAQIGFDLRRAGANLNFAPVLDLARYAQNEVIGDRAFANDPQAVASLGGAFAAGLEEWGVVATFKHFPGHGSTMADSHAELPVSCIEEGAFRRADLVPFAQLLPKARAVMTAHIVVPAIDRAPATLSSRWLRGILRAEIGFAGVCFTDCLQMDAIANTVGTAEGAVRALEAGADCVLVSDSIEMAAHCVESIEQALLSGRLSEDRLNEAAARIAALRASLQPPIDLETPSPHRGVGLEIARRALA